MHLDPIRLLTRNSNPSFLFCQDMTSEARANWIPKMSSFFVVAALSCGGFAQGQAAPSGLSSIRFLVGDWIGGGGTDVGQATGRSSIKADLSGHVLVRRDHTDIPATKERPRSSMDVLMLIYPQASDGRLHATYTDSGGHVIQYTAARVEPGRLVEFDSDSSPNTPTFRLTYAVTGPKALAVKFEMAAPGAPATFHSVAAGVLKRSGN